MSNIVFSFLFENPVPVLAITANLIFTFLLGLFIAWMYRVTHRGFSYSQSFVLSLVLLAVITEAAVVVISDSISRAFALFAAFSIIRFRTPIKDPKDIVYMFWAIMTGIMVGASYYLIAVVTTALIAVFILILTRWNFGAFSRPKHLLNFSFSGDQSAFQQQIADDLFPRYLHTYTLLTATTGSTQKFIEYSFTVEPQNNAKIGEFVEALRALHGIHSVRLVSAKNDLNY